MSYVYRGGQPAPATQGKDKLSAAAVPLKLVRFHEHNVRRDLGDLRVLTDSIASRGVITPVVLERRGETLRVRDGHRRVAAARLAGLAKIPAFIHSRALEDDADWVVNAVHANHHRAALATQDRRDAIARLRDEGLTWEDVAREFGTSTATVKRWANPSPAVPGPGARRPPPPFAGGRARFAALLEEGQLVPTADVLDRFTARANGDRP